MYARYQRAERQLSWHLDATAPAEKPPAGETPPETFFLQDNNLWVRDNSNGSTRPLTTEGEPHFAYGDYADFYRVGLMENRPLPPAVLPSKDGRYLAVQRVDERWVSDMPLQQAVPLDGSPRPRSTNYKMALPGDQHYPQLSLCIIDRQSGRIIDSDRPSQPASLVGPMETGAVRWSDDNTLYFIELDRARQTVRLIRLDPVSGCNNIVIEETGQGNIYPGPMPLGNPVFALLPEQDTLIWYSHRSGWGHLYRYQLSTGACLNPITGGRYMVTQLQAVDDKTQTVFFTACGNASDGNPYYEQLYRAKLDGSALQCLTPETAQHDIQSLCLNTHTFIDRFSRVDLPTTIVRRHSETGDILEELLGEEASRQQAKAFNHPLAFTAKAADQQTDLYGVIYRPGDVDSTKTYPVILALYGTPHECIVPRRYGETSDKVRDIYRTLAELGFIVVMMDPRGTPFRGKAFHDVAYGNLQKGGGIDDQVHVLKQLGQRHSWMDINRIGITGHSGGGFASARAMMTHGDFFKVCVSSAGNHDQRLYAAGWADTFQGFLNPDDDPPLTYQHLVDKLKGKLLLIHGDVDANVPLAQTLQLTSTLIDHNKDFDVLILPNRGHVHGQDNYFIRRLWDYFVKHLLEQTPPKEYLIKPPASSPVN